MPRVLHIEVEDGMTVEETADLLATRASNFLHDLFPARQWRQAMTLMAQRINRTAAEDDAGG
jgi:hypothetical protein